MCHPVFPRGVLVWWGGSAPTTGDRFRQYRRRIGRGDTGTQGVGERMWARRAHYSIQLHVHGQPVQVLWFEQVQRLEGPFAEVARIR